MTDNRTREEQIEDLMDHYENPRNYGDLKDATVSFKGINPGCGDIVTIYLKINAEEKIEEVRFEGEGCTISQAATSMATDIVKGKTLKEVDHIPHDYMMEVVGREVALSRPKCSTLGLNNVREAIRIFRQIKLVHNQDPQTPSDQPPSCPSH